MYHRLERGRSDSKEANEEVMVARTRALGVVMKRKDGFKTFLEVNRTWCQVRCER